MTKTVGGKQKTEKKEWNYFKLKPFEWWTYEEMLANVRQVGSGLRSLGVGGEGETFFNIYGSTSCVYLSMLSLLRLQEGQADEQAKLDVDGSSFCFQCCSHFHCLRFPRTRRSYPRIE